MTKLEKGKFTEIPVKSDFGWHVILLEDTRELKLPPIEEAKGQIGQQLQQRWCKSTSRICAPRPRSSNPRKRQQKREPRLPFFMPSHPRRGRYPGDVPAPYRLRRLPA
jgi:hypothetical protein